MSLLTAYFHCQEWENKASVLYNRHPSEKIDGTLFCLKNLIGLFLYRQYSMIRNLENIQWFKKSIENEEKDMRP